MTWSSKTIDIIFINDVTWITASEPSSECLWQALTWQAVWVKSSVEGRHFIMVNHTTQGSIEVSIMLQERWIMGLEYTIIALANSIRKKLKYKINDYLQKNYYNWAKTNKLPTPCFKQDTKANRRWNKKTNKCNCNKCKLKNRINQIIGMTNGLIMALFSTPWHHK